MQLKDMILFLILLIASIFDIRRREIPNVIPAMLAVMSLLSFETAMQGIICVGLPLLLVACLFDTIGGGDVKLITAASMNINGFLSVIFAVITLIFCTIFTKISKKSSIPLAPFACTVFFIIFLIERIVACV